MQYKEFLIRPANNEDIPAIKNVVFTVLAEYGLPPNNEGKDHDLNDIEENYFLPGGFFGVAEDITANTIIGTFGLFSFSPDICELRKMYLLKQARGKGLGKFILNRAINIARQKNYKKIVLETISPLKEAIALYKRNGFTEIIPKEINERVDSAFELNIN